MKIRKGRGFSLEELKNGDFSAEELASASQVQGPFMPLACHKPIVELVKVTKAMKSFNAYQKLRVEQMKKRHLGARLKKAAEAEKEEKKIGVMDVSLFSRESTANCSSVSVSV